MMYEVVGGVLIGLAATLLWFSVGRISGMTGVVSSVFMLRDVQRHWAFWFLLGLVLTYPLAQWFGLEISIQMTDDYGLILAAGLLVGIGTYLGNGCTSGHGVCGTARLSPRSIVATCVFIAVGVLTVALMNALFGGGA
ncbi:MAG: YeeE/YedE family protein [Bacterioplanes sp.]|nr:YeeE/YedE family protein [Bacterioplanes sp.]